MLAEDGIASAAGSYYGQCTESPVNSANLTMSAVALKGAASTTVATPTFSPGSETYASAQTVTISDTTAGSTIYYTTDGTLPTTASALHGSSGLTVIVSATETLNAIGVLSGDTNSPIGDAEYIINLTPAATPAFSPAAGTYTSIQTVTITDATSGASIYYTTNGTAPTTGSSLYGAPIPVSTTQTLEAIAVHAGNSNSTVASGIYTITLPAATPIFSPVGGSYSTVQVVTISDSTPGSTIYYTLNGTTPTTASPVYSGPITVPAPETLEAVAIANGYALSSTGSAVYTYPPPASGASYVQQCSINSPSGASGGNAVCTLSGVTAGDTLVIGVQNSAATINTFTSSTTAQPVTEISNLNDANASFYLTAAILPNTPSGSITITAKNTSTYTSIWLSVTEYTNVAASPYDTSAHTVLTSGYGNASIATPSFNTTASGDMLWTMCAGLGGGYANFFAGTIPITWTAVNSAGSPVTALVEDGSAGAAGSYTGQCQSNLTGNPGGVDDAAIVTLALKASGATASTPVFSPVAGSYTQAQSVTISTSTPSATIYYTTDGTAPTTNSATYSAPINVAAWETVNAIAVSTGYANSAVGSAAYSIGVGTPVFSPVGGSYTSIQTVTITDATVGATIYYTTNGTTPTTGSPVYSAPITVSTSQTLEALGVLAGNANSAVASAAYVINLTAATPVFSPAAGTFNSAQTVTITDATVGATIYYTTNGTAPTTNSPTYSAPISVSATETLEALATYAGDANSTVASAVYTLQVATPALSPAAGSYSTDQSVTISDSTGGATIYYTTNGTTPTTGSAIYSGPVSVTTAQTLEAIGVVTGYTNSATASAAYTFPPPSSSPSYIQQCSSQQGYGASTSCTLTGVGAGHALMIGINTNTPILSVTSSAGTTVPVVSNTNGSNLYAYVLPNTAAGSITITATDTTSTAKIWLSVVEYANVAVSPVDTSASGSLSGYTNNESTSNFTTTAANDMLWSFCYSDGNVPTVDTVPTPWTSVALAPLGSPNYLPITLVQDVSAGAAGSYSGECVNVQASIGNILAVALLSSGSPSAATPTFSPVAGSYNQPQTVTISTTTPSSTIYYTTDGSTPTTGSAAYSTPISVGAWETVEAIAVSTGYTNSAVGSAAYSIGVATPVFSPVAGSYTGTQSVSISDSTGGASIYYTTNGTTPTTGSTLYTDAVSVSTAETLEAIGAEAGYANSAVASAAYAITATTPGFSPASGTYTTIQTVSISDSTAGVTIYYTTDGTAPTTGSPVYSSAITVSATQTLSAIAAAAGDTTSAVGSAAYTINLPTAATPSFSPVAGSYTGTQSVTISDTTPSSTIYFTTDGTTPTTSSPQYSTAISISANETLEAIATAYNYLASATGSAAYTVVPTAPVFSLAGGTYYSNQTLTISDATAGATIYYTTNATTPTTNSTPYTAPLSIAATATIEAIAASGGAPAKPVASAIYTIATPAALTAPAPNTSTPLTGASVTFAWTPGNTAARFMFYVGTAGIGSSNLYNSGNVTATSETVSNLPSNGETLYVRLYWLLNGSWKDADYTYVASGSPTQAVLTTPAPNTSAPLTGASVAFSWNPGNLATHFMFYMGTTGIGSSNLYNSGNVTATTETVSGLPSNGETVNARLYSLINGAWQYTDYTYAASGAPTAAALTTPAPNTATQLTSTSVAFAWTPGNIAAHFMFYVGTSGIGSSNLYNSGNVTATTETVSNLPNNDSTVYVRLYSLINGAWQSADYTYVSAGTATQGALTVPAPNTATPLTGASVTFSWLPGNSATHFEFYVGSTGAGSSNLYNSGSVTATTETVSNLPGNGETLYMRLYSLINGAWQYTDYTYKAYGSPTQAVLTVPAPNTLTPLTGARVAFSWTPGNLATHFMLYVGSTGAGSSNIYNSGNVTATAETVSNLPGNGETLYMRLYSLINGAWQYTDYTYVSAGAPTQAALTTPAPNSQFTSTTVTFNWTPGNTATHFELYLGTGIGSSNLYNSGSVTVTTEKVSGLPSNGEKIYARLYSLINGAWKYADYTYTAF